MQDDLQKAYAAYQQALYYLRNPKVSIRRFSSQLNYLFFFPRTIQNYGTVLVSCTTDTVPWTMPKKLSLLSSKWTRYAPYIPRIINML